MYVCMYSLSAVRLQVPEELVKTMENEPAIQRRDSRSSAASSPERKSSSAASTPSRKGASSSSSSLSAAESKHSFKAPTATELVAENAMVFQLLQSNPLEVRARRVGHFIKKWTSKGMAGSKVGLWAPQTNPTTMMGHLKHRGKERVNLGDYAVAGWANPENSSADRWYRPPLGFIFYVLFFSFSFPYLEVCCFVLGFCCFCFSYFFFLVFQPPLL